MVRVEPEAGRGRTGRILIALLGCVTLGGCVSTLAKGYVGKPIEEVMIGYGAPEHVFEMPDGRRAYQFRMGGGSGVLPGNTTSTGTVVGNTAVVNTTATPAAIFSSSGCLVTFIARNGGAGYAVEEFRVPKQLVC